MLTEYERRPPHWASQIPLARRQRIRESGGMGGRAVRGREGSAERWRREAEWWSKGGDEKSGDETGRQVAFGRQVGEREG